MTARYPLAIEPGTEQTASGIVVPDLPGRFSAGDTLDEAVIGVEKAVAAWIDAAKGDQASQGKSPSRLSR